MTDEPTTKSGGQTSTSPTRLTQGDPARRPFGDLATDVAKKAEPVKYPLPGAQTDEDGGEYDKGPRAETVPQPAPAKAAPDQRPMPMHQNKPGAPPPQSQPATKRDETGKDACGPSKDFPGKAGDKSGGGCDTP